MPPSPYDDPNHFDIYQNYEIESDFRDELRNYLNKNGIKTILQWGGKTIHQFPDLKLNKDVPFTEKITQRYMLLPINTSLSDSDIMYVCDKIHSFYSSKKLYSS